MPDRPLPDKTRRRVVRGLLALPAVSLLSLTGCEPAPSSQAATLTPTPTCDDGDDHDSTPRQTAGPFFTPDSPERASLREAGLSGTLLVVTGRVLTTTCEPVPHALLDLWHADDAGDYDNEGFRYRGHQFADAEGRYRLETVVPGHYPGRVRHIHVHAQAPNNPILTTQLYFPDDPGNARDGLFRETCLMAVTNTPDGQEATFDFILDLG